MLCTFRNILAWFQIVGPEEIKWIYMDLCFQKLVNAVDKWKNQIQSCLIALPLHKLKYLIWYLSQGKCSINAWDKGKLGATAMGGWDYPTSSFIFNHLKFRDVFAVSSMYHLISDCMDMTHFRSFQKILTNLQF